ncbi:TetR/AcrR family transcriptional regulator C-terminal domain-containing protein [Streptomyces sp. NPDC048338]|uniref:TetR/AcrR family transcriptional regulator C-terminal domain-containing protein n=1 Tax=Streptomyces sp. NPDC048338 TaxID=3365536 RepID=UPI003721D49A
MADQGLLRIDDAVLAANHFSGLLLWIWVNKAMSTSSRSIEVIVYQRLLECGACLP